MDILTISVDRAVAAAAVNSQRKTFLYILVILINWGNYRFSILDYTLKATALQIHIILTVATRLILGRKAASRFCLVRRLSGAAEPIDKMATSNARAMEANGFFQGCSIK